MTRAVRGAVQFDTDNKEKIKAGTQKLIAEMMRENGIKEEDLISIIFSVTDDLRTINPAAALRAGGGYADTPLFCTKEPDCDGMLPRVIRALMSAESDLSKKEIRHIYSGGAEKLRPDLS